MKKSISLLVLLALVAAGAFAQVSLSAGGGLLFDLSLNNGVEVAGEKSGMDATSFGGFVFFDATYVEVDIGFTYGLLDSYVGSSSADGGSMLALNFALLGKYPIPVGSFTIFPLLGVNYNLVLSHEDKDGNSNDKAGDLSQFGILAGMGADFNLTTALYLRAEALFQLRFANKVMSDAADDYHGDTTFGLGPVIKVALGYKF